MSSILRTSLAVSRARPFSPIFSAVPRRFASSDYGSVQGGQEQGTEQKNPMKHMEHPGPESPADQEKSGSSSGSSAPSKSDSSGASKGGAEPKITQSKDSGKEQSEDVKQHNKEMENRADKPVNQINDQGDSKVDKEFWEGDVGGKNVKK